MKNWRAGIAGVVGLALLGLAGPVGALSFSIPSGAIIDDVDFGGNEFFSYTSNTLTVGIDATTTFYRIKELAHGRPPVAVACSLSADREPAPRMTESWFC